MGEKFQVQHPNYQLLTANYQLSTAILAKSQQPNHLGGWLWCQNDCLITYWGRNFKFSIPVNGQLLTDNYQLLTAIDIDRSDTVLFARSSSPPPVHGFGPSEKITERLRLESGDRDGGWGQISEHLAPNTIRGIQFEQKKHKILQKIIPKSLQNFWKNI